MTPVQNKITPLIGSDEQFHALLSADTEIPYGRFNYPCRLKTNPAASYLSVQLHGNIPERRSVELPVFGRWNWGKVLGAHVLAICDPTIYLDDSLRIGWYLGEKKESAIPGVVAIACRCAQVIGIPQERIIFSGSSGGGFAALQAAALLEDGKVLAINAQTDLARFSPRQVLDYVEKASGCKTLAEAEHLYGARWSAISRLQQAGGQGAGRKIVLVQNRNDWHYQEHFTPFAQAFGLNLAADQSISGNFMSILYDGPNSHEVEPFAVVKEYVRIGIPFLLGEDAAPSLEPETHITLESGKIRVVIQTSHDDAHFACYLCRDGVAMEKQFYSPDCNFVFDLGGAGKYHAQGFVRDKNGQIFSSISATITIHEPC